VLSKNSVASVRNDPPVWLQFARDAWQHRGERRPRSAEDSGPGQESVWDYPRPPVVVPDDRSVKVLRGSRPHGVDGPVGAGPRDVAPARVLSAAGIGGSWAIGAGAGLLALRVERSSRASGG
jgi:hypothetical protein